MNETRTPAGRLGMPSDLREWIPGTQLSQWIRDEIATLDWKNSKQESVLPLHSDFRPEALLGVLVYGYLTGQFESDEIVSGCYADPVLRELSSGIAPASRDLKSFRREHSGFIRNALAHLLRRIVDFRFGDTTRGTDLRRALLDLASERLEVARHMDRGMIWD